MIGLLKADAFRSVLSALAADVKDMATKCAPVLVFFDSERPPFSSAAGGISHLTRVIGRRRMGCSNLDNRRSLALWSRNYTLDVLSGS